MSRWHQFNAIIDNNELNAKEKGVLLIIFRFIDSEAKYAYPSRKVIKRLAKITDNRTLDKILNTLIEKGFIKRKSGYTGRCSQYYLTVKTNKKYKLKENTTIDCENSSYQNDDEEFTTNII